MISIYLLDKYFVNAKTPDYAEAQRLATLMLKANPDNGRLRKLKKQLDGLKNSRLQAMLPVVSSTDINGKSISTSQVKGKIGVISTWATWNFPSTDIQRKLRKLQKQYPQELSLISICIDGDKRECKKRVDRDSLPSSATSRCFRHLSFSNWDCLLFLRWSSPTNKGKSLHAT